MENGGIAADTTPDRLFAMEDGVDSWSPGRPGLCNLLAAVGEAGIPVDPACFDLEEAADMIRARVFNGNHHSSPGESQPC